MFLSVVHRFPCIVNMYVVLCTVEQLASKQIRQDVHVISSRSGQFTNFNFSVKTGYFDSNQYHVNAHIFYRDFALQCVDVVAWATGRVFSL